MRILELFANHKFTGPADPALVTSRALQDLGHDVTFVAGKSKEDGSSGVGDLARQRGLQVDGRLDLPKHSHPKSVIRDVRVLREWLSRERFDVIHTHTRNDHLVAALATTRGTPPIVRTIYDAERPRGLRMRVALARSAAVVVFSDSLVKELEGRTSIVERHEPVLDASRFTDQRDPSVRESWGLGDGAFVVGVVARMQTHRRFPELIEGFASVAERRPNLHLVVLGRGTNQEVVAKQPARQSKTPGQIHFPGYIDPERYPSVLPSFDALVFLVPGSDGTCRAAREALVSGVPVVASPRGLLPTIVEPGRTGFVLDGESAAAIGSGIERLVSNPDETRRMGRQARKRALERFDPTAGAARLIQLFERIKDEKSTT